MKTLLLLLTLAAACAAAPPDTADNAVMLTIAPTREHPRSSEGAFLTLRSGRILFYYTQFYGGDADHSPARIVGIFSDDGGRTWSAPQVVIGSGGRQNVMSVSLLPLAGGRLGLFHGIKNSFWDNHPCLRTSADDGATWSKPRMIVTAPGYFSKNNDRVIRTRTGRLIYPMAQYRPIVSAKGEREAMDARGIVLWYCSDDDGATWREAATWWALPVASQGGLQEPGVVELADGSLFSWARTDQGEQYGFRSRDNGETWSAPEPTELKSPLSPASIKRLPNSAALLAVYNDHSGRFPVPSDLNRRTPLVTAISTDGGRTWPVRRLIEDDPNGRYCYTAIHFVDGAVLLAYSGVGVNAEFRWGGLRIRRIGLAWLAAP